MNNYIVIDGCRMSGLVAALEEAIAEYGDLPVLIETDDPPHYVVEASWLEYREREEFGKSILITT